MKINQEERPYRVLSLGGGGMRGIYTAALLDHLIRLFSQAGSEGELDFGFGFDLITGTSTGAIVGCALAVGMHPAKVAKFYRQHGSRIFPHRIAGKMSALFRATQGNRYVKSGDQALRSALDDAFGDTTMLDVYRERNISLSIPAVLMSNHRAWVFKKTPLSGTRDDNYRLADVCMASSAAPIYRSLAAIRDPNSKCSSRQVFADGGLWANNPILVGLVDALKIAEPSQPIEIFSIGSCPQPTGDYFDEDSVHRSILDWSFGAEAVTLSIASQEFVVDEITRFLAEAFNDCGRRVRRVRFPISPLPASMFPYLGIDDAREEAMDRLTAQAQNDANKTKSMCDDPNDEEGQMISQLMNDLQAARESTARRASALYY